MFENGDCPPGGEYYFNGIPTIHSRLPGLSCVHLTSADSFVQADGGGKYHSLNRNSNSKSNLDYMGVKT